MNLVLDRMALDDVGANPQRIADAIHEQLGEGSGPVPVREIALALDVVEIREEPLTNIEGALVTTPERGSGSILVNANSGPQRRRFSIGHELGHFLNAWHRPTSPVGFQCSRLDMIAADLKDRNRYLRQEAEANAFAIELLTPRKRIRPYLRGEPDLRAVRAMSDEFDISREAAARRYVSLHEEDLAVAFSRNGSLIYAERSRGFPWLCLTKGQNMPCLPSARPGSPISDREEAVPEDWIRRADGVQLIAETLHQQRGFAITLLRVRGGDEEPDEIDDTYQRFARVGYRRGD